MCVKELYETAARPRMTSASVKSVRNGKVHAAAHTVRYTGAVRPWYSGVCRPGAADEKASSGIHSPLEPKDPGCGEKIATSSPLKAFKVEE